MAGAAWHFSRGSNAKKKAGRCGKGSCLALSFSKSSSCRRRGLLALACPPPHCIDDVRTPSGSIQVAGRIQVGHLPILQLKMQYVATKIRASPSAVVRSRTAVGPPQIQDGAERRASSRRRPCELVEAVVRVRPHSHGTGTLPSPQPCTRGMCHECIAAPALKGDQGHGREEERQELHRLGIF